MDTHYLVDSGVNYGPLTKPEGRKLIESFAGYLCDENLRDCAMMPTETESEGECNQYHLTASFMDQHNDNVGSAFAAVDRMLLRV